MEPDSPYSSDEGKWVNLSEGESLGERSNPRPSSSQASTSKESVAVSSIEPSGSEYEEEAEEEGEAEIESESESESGPEDRCSFEILDDTGAVPSGKRAAVDAPPVRPFKRRKGGLNLDYLDLLNQDIEDAAERLCFEDDVDLPPEQFGLVCWTSQEKRDFFEALARLGQYDLEAIAARVRTKSVFEVCHYMRLLQEARRARKGPNSHATIVLAEYPAVVELSPQCCHAQEEAADAISLRQEVSEQHREESKWGDIWNITPKVAHNLDEKSKGGSDESQPHFARLFRLSRLLQLSRRIFMNSSVPSNNWHFIDDDPPSIWATTAEDLFSLTLSLTRRLVQATLFISMSRIRAKQEFRPQTKPVVRRKDVEAAVTSLDLSHGTGTFWAKSARRLRLDVYMGASDRELEADEGPLSYDEVERLLKHGNGAKLFERDDFGSGVRETAEFRPSLAERQGAGEGEPLDSDSDPSSQSESNAEASQTCEEGDEIEAEAREILEHSAVNFHETYRTKEALKHRIAVERQQEQYANQCDEYASWRAETEMWDILQKRPLEELPKVQEPGPLTRSNMDVESIFPMGREWANKIRFRSPWETKRAAE